MCYGVNVGVNADMTEIALTNIQPVNTQVLHNVRYTYSKHSIKR